MRKLKLKPLPLHKESLYAKVAGHGDKKPVNSPGHDTIPVENREGTDSGTGSDGRLAWGSRTDIGLVRSHNEDSFLVQAPVFAVCDGMGGMQPGEVAAPSRSRPLRRTRRSMRTTCSLVRPSRRQTPR